jgi:hypothetical protein
MSEPVAEWNRNFNQEPFAKVFATPHGQLLAYIDYSDEDEEFRIRVIGAPVRGVTPAANLGYFTEDARQTGFDRIDQQLADDTAKSLFETADQLAPVEDHSHD